MGTAVIFEESREPMEGDPIFDTSPDITLKYKYKTTKRLNMERIFIERKDEPSCSNTKLERTIPTCSTLEEAFDKLVKEANEMNISDSEMNDD